MLTDSPEGRADSAAAAAKSLQSCPTLCDPIDGSPPGSPNLGILQARTLEWVAISFSNAWKWKVKVRLLGRVRPSATPWSAAYQAPPFMGFSRQEYWSVVPLPSPRADSRSLKTVLKASLSLNYFVVSLNKAPIVKNSNEPVTFVIRQPLVLTSLWKMTAPSPPKKKKMTQRSGEVRRTWGSGASHVWGAAPDRDWSGHCAAARTHPPHFREWSWCLLSALLLFPGKRPSKNWLVTAPELDFPMSQTGFRCNLQFIFTSNIICFSYSGKTWLRNERPIWVRLLPTTNSIYASLYPFIIKLVLNQILSNEKFTKENTFKESLLLSMKHKTFKEFCFLPATSTFHLIFLQ